MCNQQAAEGCTLVGISKLNLVYSANLACEQYKANQAIKVEASTMMLEPSQQMHNITEVIQGWSADSTQEQQLWVQHRA